MLKQFKILDEEEFKEIMQENEKIQLELNNDNAVEINF